jgi:hypothetical protein
VRQDDEARTIVVNVATVFKVFDDVAPTGGDVVEDLCFGDVVAGEAPIVGGEDLGKGGPLMRAELVACQREVVVFAVNELDGDGATWSGFSLVFMEG